MTAETINIFIMTTTEAALTDSRRVTVYTASECNMTKYRLHWWSKILNHEEILQKSFQYADLVLKNLSCNQYFHKNTKQQNLFSTLILIKCIIND